MNINFALYLLQTIFQNIEYIPLIETLLLCLFGEYIDKRLHNLIKTQTEIPLSYNYRWSFKNCWDDTPEFLSQKYDENFSKKENKIEEVIKRKESFEEIILEEETKKIFTKYDNLMSKLGLIKNKLATTSNHFMNYIYQKKLIDYEKEYRAICKIIASSLNLDDSLNNIEISFPTLIKDTIDNLIGFNKELNEMNEKISCISLDEKKLQFKKNEFSEILKSFLKVKIICFLE